MAKQGLYRGNRDFGLRIASGELPQYSIVNKFGRNSAVSTSFVPICEGGKWQTPQAGSATTLRIKAGGNANDTAAGTGGRAVTLQGLDATGALIEDTITTNGESAGTASTKSFMRLFRAKMDSSGSYATVTALSGSHDAAITIENGAGGTDWATIYATDVARSQSQIGCYSVPLEKKAFLTNLRITNDSNKVVDVLMFQRQNILQTAAPYSGMRLVQEFSGITAPVDPPTFFCPPPFPALTDIIFLAKVSTGTAAVTIEFDLILEDA